MDDRAAHGSARAAAAGPMATAARRPRIGTWHAVAGWGGLLVLVPSGAKTGSRWVSAGGSGLGREPASGIEGPDPAIAAKSAPAKAAPTMVHQRRPAMRSRSGRTCGQPPAKAWYSATALADRKSTRLNSSHVKIS